jgi:hypothetical protein
MRTVNRSQIICQLREVKAEGGQLVFEGTVQLQVPIPQQDYRLPADVERHVEAAGQEFKRWMYRQLMEKLDAELLLFMRGGRDGEGFVCHGRRTMTFKTVFGTVQVSRHRIVHAAERTSEVPAAMVWDTPRQVTITQGLIDATCDAMLQESSRKSLRHIEDRAGEPGLLGRVTVLNLVHEEGRQLRDAARCRAEAVFATDPEATRCLLPHVAEPLPEEASPPAEEEEGKLWEALAGFPGAPASDVVKEDEPRRVDPDTVMVQADEVSVHAQASTGCKKILVYNAVVSTPEKTWYFSEENTQNLIFLVGALLAILGVHQGERRLLFVNDGARWIRDWFEGVQVKAKSMVLCWYHLAHRCLMDLGSACGKRRAGEIGKDVLGHLWEGRVDEALELLAQHRTEMNNRSALNQIVDYIRARRPYLPNYKARKDAGVWIASNRVERLNDWTTSQRCKHRGMDWTREGVVSLAILESSRRNGELPVWRRSRILPAWRVYYPLTQAT